MIISKKTISLGISFSFSKLNKSLITQIIFQKYFIFDLVFMVNIK